MNDRASSSSPSGMKNRIWVKHSGFTTLFEPPHKSAVADVVFIHGLQGHPWRTWRYKGEVQERTPVSSQAISRRPWILKRSKEWDIVTENRRVYWPADLLAVDQDDIRILTYGYDSKVTRWFGGAANQMSVEEHANSFLHSLEAERRNCSGRPLIFIAHSLGGLLVKVAISQSRSEQHHFHLRDAYDSLHALIFFGTPHRGSEDAAWGLLLRNIANAASFDTNARIIEQLDPNHGAAKLDELNVSLAEILKEKGTVRVTSFQESKGKAGWSFLGLNEKVVPNESSALNLKEYEILDSINANHMDMCRFSDSRDDGYVKTRSALALHIDRIRRIKSGRSIAPSVEVFDGETKYLPHRPQPPVQAASTASESAPPVIDSEATSMNKDLLAQTRKSLYFPEISSRSSQIYNDSSESFEWIWSTMSPKESFTNWLSTGAGTYWITGRPGSGKSTLIKYIINHPKTHEILQQSPSGSEWNIVSFFFDFRAGDGLANNFEGLLRSLLLQIINKTPALAATIHTQGIDKLDPNLVLKWDTQKLRYALKSALKSSTANFCIFVDGLDEYDGSYLLLTDFFSSKDIEAKDASSPNVKLCLASRPEPILVEYLRNCAGFTMQDYNRPSISKYVSFRFEPLVQEDAEMSAKLVQSVTDSSNGIILWSRLAADDLLDGWSYGETEKELLRRLEAIPKDVKEIYSRILRRTRAGDRAECSVMLRLLCHAPAVLNLAQFSILVSIAMSDGSVDITKPTESQLTRFLKRLRGCTRSLVECHTPNLEIKGYETALHERKARLLHKTVKTYLEEDTWKKDLGVCDYADELSGEELWLRCMVKYVDLATAPPNNLSLDAAGFDDRSPLHDFCKICTRILAAQFEKKQNRSSGPYLRHILSRAASSQKLYLLGPPRFYEEPLTALSLAVGWNLRLFFSEEIENGSDINEHEGRALEVGIINLSPLVLFMLNHGATVRDSHLLFAIRCHVDSAIPLETLIEHSVHGKTDFRKVRLQHKNLGPVSPLYIYLISDFWSSDSSSRHLLVKSAEDIDTISGPFGTPLHVAVAAGNAHMCAKLIELLGADVNFEGPFGKPLDLALYCGYSSLDNYFSLPRYADIFATLVHAGAFTNVVPHAVMAQLLDAARALLRFESRGGCEKMRRSFAELMRQGEVLDKQRMGEIENLLKLHKYPYF